MVLNFTLHTLDYTLVERTDKEMVEMVLKIESKSTKQFQLFFEILLS